jgi:hypothetical protein
MRPERRRFIAEMAPPLTPRFSVEPDRACCAPPASTQPHAVPRSALLLMDVLARLLARGGQRRSTGSPQTGHVRHRGARRTLGGLLCIYHRSAIRTGYSVLTRRPSRVNPPRPRTIQPRLSPSPRPTAVCRHRFTVNPRKLLLPAAVVTQTFSAPYGARAGTLHLICPALHEAYVVHLT